MIERRKYATRIGRCPLPPPVDGDHKRGHIAASIAGESARIPEGASAEFRLGWRAGLLDRYCAQSVAGDDPNIAHVRAPEWMEA